MPANTEARLLASPWKEFLSELDGMLNEPLELHCIGGFVFTHFYGLPRTTGDIDYYTAIPANLNLDEVAGQGSPLHTKHGVWIHRVPVANLPEDYASRLTDMAPAEFKYLKLLVLHTTASCRSWSAMAQKTGTMLTICFVPKN